MGELIGLQWGEVDFRGCARCFPVGIEGGSISWIDQGRNATRAQPVRGISEQPSDKSWDLLVAVPQIGRGTRGFILIVPKLCP